jgi:hypothetical protein
MAREIKPPTQELKPGLVINNEDLIEARAKERKVAQLNKGSKARLDRAARLHADWQRRAKKYWATNPKLSKSAVARLIATDADYSDRTIRRIIKK